ncbi:hypothetical protein DFR50_116121 [Roseiarcus fermentans]|uniref:IPT/TIG domain-containing protein n=1 Tax=Roseiarcus fermentans TaxID=1473586 RepID=A0A366FBF1_9HYPH|nr:hypothetical protein DFR50_116121 [Roseiarcus fermentans]
MLANRTRERPVPRIVSFISAVSVVLMAAACPQNPNLHPAITVNNAGGQTLSITGTGFSHYNPCAQLSVIGPNRYGNATITNGAACSLGVISPAVTWRYSYFGCQPSAEASFTIFAVDLAYSGNGAAATISLPWGPNCALSTACGALGQNACPSGCQVGGVDPKSGTCVSCGTEGQPVCTATSGCQSGFHPNGVPAYCTASCGGVNGPACITDGSAYGVTYVYHCYGGSTIDPSGVCVPDSSPRPCSEINSGGTGEPEPAVFIPQGCR